MKGLFYAWITFQITAGIWLFISPWLLGPADLHVLTNNMLFGALVVILGVGMAFYEFYHRERVEKGSLLPRLFYPWIAFQLLVGVWLFVSPFVLGFSGTNLAINDMLFGSIVFVLGIGTIFFELYHTEDFPALGHPAGRT